MPIKYVLVPCRVIGPGLHPRILITLLVSLVTAGIVGPMSAQGFKNCEVMMTEIIERLKFTTQLTETKYYFFTFIKLLLSYNCRSKAMLTFITQY